MPINETVTRLFNESKNVDEFEFICTLINYKGLGSRLSTSNLLEWFDAIEFYKTLFNSETDDNKKIRIGLLLYSTFFESSDLYNILGSLSRIKLGYRSSPYLYFKHQKADRWFGTGEKISMVNEILIDSGFEEIEQFFTTVHHKEIRNTFFHSSYSIEEDDYQLHDSDPVIVENVGHYVVSISTFLLPKINKVIEFFDSFKSQFLFHFNSYTQNKTVTGRFPERINIQILGTANGLAGFIANGSYIRLNGDFWEGMNIRFDFPSETDRYIIEELTRQINKADVRSNDGALQRLYDVISERNKLTEKQDLAKVYGRFAIMFREKANQEENSFKKTSLYQLSLNYFEKMYELDSSIILNQDFAVLKFVVGDRTNDDKLRKDALKTIIDCIDLDNLQENILKNTLHIISALREKGLDITNELKGAKKIIDSITTKDFEKLIIEIKSKL